MRHCTADGFLDSAEILAKRPIGASGELGFTTFLRERVYVFMLSGIMLINAVSFKTSIVNRIAKSRYSWFRPMTPISCWHEENISYAQTGRPTKTRLLARETIFSVVCIVLTVVHSAVPVTIEFLLEVQSSPALTVFLRVNIVRNGNSKLVDDVREDRRE